MTQLTDRIDAFKTALATDAALLAWAQGQYGRPHVVHVYGLDERQPPGAADCPYIALQPSVSRTGQAQTRRERQFELLFGIFDEQYADDPVTHVREYRGGRNLCIFIELALQALGAQDVGNELLGEIEAQFESVEFFPIFLAGLPFTLSEDLVLSADRLAL